VADVAGRNRGPQERDPHGIVVEPSIRDRAALETFVPDPLVLNQDPSGKGAGGLFASRIASRTNPRQSILLRW
jgi:hypothetical protein